ncbi:GNAT family N-acetyltransferase [Jeotgalibacillus campisalis]|uniref:GCN5-related N-acetyltransferase n=1 Tax=Jeotgalibacillus campisalis TaxID=220754 RepID=A0A0C2S0G1_9BACL|nr:GNAT family N-acetyltransferase [Jeotgalibacillus campisalis]KIL47519.1 GCN5-related N-acetyltransferase [Jeotgalibacillus campisalis]
MLKEFYIYQGENLLPVKIRNYSIEDANSLIQIQKNAFPPPFPKELLWTKEQISEHATLFRDGALCIEVNGELAGSFTAMRTELDDQKAHTWEEITDAGWMRMHNNAGTTLYVVDICVDPSFRGLGLGRELMCAAYQTVVHLKLKRLAGGGRIPGYSAYKNIMPAATYFEKLITGQLKDPVFSFLIGVGRTPVRLIHNYIEDEESDDCAVLMEWKNPFN